MASLKPYELHEREYRRMREKGIRFWDEVSGNRATSVNGMDPAVPEFLEKALALDAAPKAGKALELGCGTGPIARWLCGKGFSTVGVDVSATAVEMAKEQSEGLDARFVAGDVCGEFVKIPGRFDLAVDGHCLHCITRAEDRARFFENAHRALRTGGMLVVLTMCAPVDRKAAAEVLGGHQRLMGSIVYAECAALEECEDTRTVGGKPHFPSRYVGHRRDIVKEIRAACFEPVHTSVTDPSSGDPFSTLHLAAVAK
jgi:SAM-dependent methyltransferase